MMAARKMLLGGLASWPRRSRVIVLLMCGGLALAGFTREVDAQAQPIDSEGGHGYHEFFPNHSTPMDLNKIRDVDFGNLSMVVFRWSRKTQGEATLRDGFWEQRDDSGYRSIKLESVDYLGGPDSDGNFALVLYTWFGAGGSSNSNGIAQVVKLAAGQLTVLQQVDWDEHFYTKSPYSSFDPKTKTLVIRSAHYLPGDAHCCVSAMDVVTLRWNGTRFVQTAIETEPSQYAIDNQKEASPAQSTDH